ncbi:MAG: penicillin-binding protein 1B, partial [Gammaproteobacteria bacterium]|nr:penicillin-binding protein 1B [Gammaproteobacteria bacterium]
MARSAKKSRKRSPRKQGRLSWKIRLILVLGVISVVYLGYLYFLIISNFEGRRWALPASVYARPMELYEGMSMSSLRFVTELKRLGYTHVAAPDQPGSYNQRGNVFYLTTRPFDFWDGSEPSQAYRLTFSDQKVSDISLVRGNTKPGVFRLDPVLIGKIYPAHNEDRVLVKLEEVPERLINALIATEDRAFYKHPGIDVRAVFRALMVNMKAGETLQGGSTLTQQLVKNYFLTSDRTIWRKLNEAIMSILLELNYDKGDILESYINEIYLGQDGKRSIHGFGLASQFYFNKPLSELKLPQIATLVSLVRGASYYDPRRHPERALARRNMILDLLVSQKKINARFATAAKNSPLGVVPKFSGQVTSVPAFMDLVKRQLRRDYRTEDLTSEGLRIFTTLDPHVQKASEQSLSQRIKRLGQDFASVPQDLQGAVIVTDRNSGEVLAVVGGRDAQFAGFNRALDAVRQVGSAIKPAVYLAALSQQDKYHLGTILDDSPFTYQSNDEEWAPKNYDGQFHGQVALYKALANSYNVPTARMALDVGIDNVIKTIRQLGVKRALNIYPSIVLGAAALAPIELTQMYQTLASGGFHLPLRSIRAVLSMNGEPLSRYPLSVEQVVSPAAT